VLTASSADSIEGVMVNLGEFSQHWNENNLRWMTAVSDPTESYEAFLVVQQEVGADQGALLAELELWVDALDPELRPALEPLLENYRTRYRHMVDGLFPATLGTDNDVFQAALLEHESQGLPEYNEAAVRAFFAHPTVASGLGADGADLDAMADSLMATLAGS
jgi:hypothetical protein